MNFIDTLKQYGLYNTLIKIFFYMLKPFIRINSFIVLYHRGTTNYENKLKLITKDKIEIWFNNQEINELDYNRFKNFVNKNCIGFYIEVENELAAWGFNQMSGKFIYGENYSYNLPNNCYMLKNLYVKPQFRGKSLGPKINKARVDNKINKEIGLCFVIPENRYAMRNLKKIGCEESILVKYTIWFNKIYRRNIKVLNSNKISNNILKGFE